ncbi:MAG: hypothetical protein M3Q09_04000 [Gemmatimonadota bacterium]|nr:hypothetical protein [Gemmatimonadota bacterium]
MVRIRRLLVAALITTSVPGATPDMHAAPHPIHTSLAEVTHEAASRTVHVSLRVFVDDYAKASSEYARRLAARPGAVTRTESPLVTYALAAFALSDKAGRRVPLKSCGGKRVGELMWLCFRAPAPRGLSGFQVQSLLLFDMFDDQINIVQASYGGKKTSMLFTRGDRARRIP